MNDFVFKNVLIINEYSMHEHNPLGITLSSIFSDWPESNLCELYRYQTPGLKIAGRRSFKLPPNSVPIDHIIRRIAHKQITAPQLDASFQISAKTALPLKQKLVLFVKYFAESMFVCRTNSRVFKEVQNFKPQVIYTNGESLVILKACCYFSIKLNIPVVLHYMDNWRETAYPQTGMLSVLNRLYLKNLQRLEHNMQRGLVVSPKMKDAYSMLNPQVKYSVLLNSVSDEFYNHVPMVHHSSKKIIFTYIGGLHLNRWESLLKLDSCIGELKKSGIAARLFIYTLDGDAAIFSARFDQDCTEFRNYLPHDQIIQAYSHADILVHVESFDEEVVQYTKYSLSTKIPECMAIGKPILCYAPAGLAVSEYIKDSRSGIAADNYNDLLKAAAILASDARLRGELGENGRTVARNEHTHQKALATLLECL